MTPSRFRWFFLAWCLLIAALCSLAGPVRVVEAHSTTDRVHEIRHVLAATMPQAPCVGAMDVPVLMAPWLWGYEGWAYDCRDGKPGIVLAEDTRAKPTLQLCDLLAHEYKHVRGIGHSADPFSLMFPVIGWNTHHPGCLSRFG